MHHYIKTYLIRNKRTNEELFVVSADTRTLISFTNIDQNLDYAISTEYDEWKVLSSDKRHGDTDASKILSELYVYKYFEGNIRLVGKIEEKKVEEKESVKNKFYFHNDLVWMADPDAKFGIRKYNINGKELKLSEEEKILFAGMLEKSIKKVFDEIKNEKS